MGLDIVELIMDAEEAFGVRIPDNVAATLTTPRTLIDYVHSQLPKSSEPRCLSQTAFYAIRQAMVQRIGLSRSQLRPATELLAVLPLANAQAVWSGVGESLGNPKWPRARGGSWLARVFLPLRLRTLGEAARHVATFSPGAVKPTGEGWSWDEVAAVIEGLMCYHFGIRDYSVDDSFVADLGLD
jgi:hypothetical protein